MAVLGRSRGALSDELSVNPALPMDLEAQVFGYIDELHEMRAAALAARPRKGAPAPPGADATPGAGA